MWRLFPLSVVLILACATPAAPPPSPPLEERLAAAARELAASRSPEAEAILVAGGHDSLPYLRDLVDSSADDVSMLSRSIMLSIEGGGSVPIASRVDVLLFDLTRPEPHLFAALRALEELSRLDPKGLQALRLAATEGGERGRAAQRLLEHRGEAP